MSWFRRKVSGDPKVPSSQPRTHGGEVPPCTAGNHSPATVLPADANRSDDQSSAPKTPPGTASSISALSRSASRAHDGQSLELQAVGEFEAEVESGHATPERSNPDPDPSVAMVPPSPDQALDLLVVAPPRTAGLDAATMLERLDARLDLDESAVSTGSHPVSRPSGRPYRPDSVIDGWEANGIAIVAASLRGHQHRYHRTERQDDLALHHCPETGLITVAVTDGVSAAPDSHIGANLVARQAISYAERQRGPLDGDQWAALFHEAAYALQERAEHDYRASFPEEAAIRLAHSNLATTLVVAQVVPPTNERAARVSGAGIGDSGIWLVDSLGRWKPIVGSKPVEGAYTSNAVSPLPILPDEINVQTFDLDAGVTVFVGSDGFGDPLDTGNGDVGELFWHLTRSGLPRATIFASALDFRRDPFFDDRTAVAIQLLREA